MADKFKCTMCGRYDDNDYYYELVREDGEDELEHLCETCTEIVINFIDEFRKNKEVKRKKDK